MQLIQSLQKLPLLKKQNYTTHNGTYNFYEKNGDSYKFKKMDFFNDIFNVTIDNFRPMSFDLTFRIRNNVTINVKNKDFTFDYWILFYKLRLISIQLYCNGQGKDLY